MKRIYRTQHQNTFVIAACALLIVVLTVLASIIFDAIAPAIND